MPVHARHAIVLSLAAAAALSAGPALAASISTSSIQPFNTALGALQQVIITLDPDPAVTSNHFTGEDNIVGHAHTAITPPVTIVGLGTFTFAPTTTSIAESEAFDQHNHSLDVVPTTEVFTGSALDWFLNPANPTITSVGVAPFLVAAAEGHQHQVSLPAITPDVTYIYTPIPEPAAACLLALPGLLCSRRRASR